MPEEQFDYTKLTDREIIILSAQKLHDLLNDSEDHEKRLTDLETTRTYLKGVAYGGGLLGFGWMAKLHLMLNNITSAISSKGH